MDDLGKDELQFKVRKEILAFIIDMATFVTKVAEMLDTIRRLLCRALFWYLDISRFTVKKNITIKTNCL